MALYFQCGLAERNSVFQNDKTNDKKFFANSTIRGTLGTHGTVSIPTAVLVTSFPLNAEEIELKSVLINKQIHMIATGGLVTFYNLEKMGVPLPLVTFHILAGIGDQQTNVNILNISDFNSQNALFVPAVLHGSNEKMEIPIIKEKFLLTKNTSFLNIFIYMMVENTGDVTTFQTDFNAIYAAKGGVLTMGNFLFDISVFVSGKTQLKCEKKFKKI